MPLNVGMEQHALQYLRRVHCQPTIESPQCGWQRKHRIALATVDFDLCGLQAFNELRLRPLR